MAWYFLGFPTVIPPFYHEVPPWGVCIILASMRHLLALIVSYHGASLVVQFCRLSFCSPTPLPGETADGLATLLRN